MPDADLCQSMALARFSPSPQDGRSGEEAGEESTGRRKDLQAAVWSIGDTAEQLLIQAWGPT